MSVTHDNTLFIDIIMDTHHPQNIHNKNQHNDPHSTPQDFNFMDFLKIGGHKPFIEHILFKKKNKKRTT